MTVFNEPGPLIPLDHPGRGEVARFRVGRDVHGQVTLDELAVLIRDYYRAGGADLHVELEDGNVDAAVLVGGLLKARERGDSAAENILLGMLNMSVTDRHYLFDHYYTFYSDEG